MNNKDIVSKISFREREILPGKFGFESLTWLNSALTESKPTWAFHSQADGMGSDFDKNTSILKSLSESMERWAWLETQEEKKFRYDIVPDTSGFAAYPNLFKKYSKNISRAEAFERWCLLSFWVGDIKLTNDSNRDVYQYYDSSLSFFCHQTSNHESSKTCLWFFSGIISAKCYLGCRDRMF